VQDDQNYGRSREPGDVMGGSAGDPFDGAGRPARSAMSHQDERTWSMLAHLSVLAGLVGLLPLGALIIWLVYRDRSRRVGFHALQALWYQVAWLVIWVVASIIGLVFTLVTLGIGILLVLPAALLLWLAPLVHGCYAAYQVSQGVDYRYPFIADRIDGGARRTL
jgi:uncharacterized protein